MLQAKDNNEMVVTPALLKREQLLVLKEKGTFYCPVCNERVIMRVGVRKIPHFAHHAKSSCSFKSEGEGHYHEQGKLQLYQWLMNQGLSAELEVYLPEIKQRPDLLVTIGKKKIAIEYQCAQLSQSDFLKRNKGYQQLAITPIWVLGGNRMRRAGPQTLILNPSDMSFLHKFFQGHPLSLFFYCPETNFFSIFSSIQTTGKKKAFGNLQFYHLKKLVISDLWKNPPSRNTSILLNWKKEISNFRTQPPITRNQYERQWREYLYMKNIHPYLLPAIAYLPVSSQFLLNSPAWIWQSKILIDLISVNQVITTNSCHRLLFNHSKNSNNFPLIFPNIDPITEYLLMLKSLNYLEQLTHTEFRVIKDVSYKRRMEDVLNDDDLLFRQLSFLY